MAPVPEVKSSSFVPLPEVSQKANRWLQEKLRSFNKETIQELTPDERSQIIEAAKNESKKERVKCMANAILVTLAAIIILPILLVLSFFLGSSILEALPNSLYFPAAAGGILGGGFAGWKLIQGAGYFYQSTYLRWQEAHHLEVLSQHI